MNESKFPSDPMQDLRDLQRTVADGQSTGKSPLLSASAGWVMRHRATPTPPPSGDVHIYAQNGRLWATSTLGTVPLLNIPHGANVIVPGITAPNAPASYSQSQAQAISDGLATTYNSLVELVLSLRTAGVIG